MSKDRLETGSAPNLSITCHGDLVVKVWDEPAVSMKGEYELEEKAGLWTLTGQGDLQVRVPQDAALHIAEVAGDAVVKAGGVDVVIETINGDLVLRGVAGAKIGAVHGDFALRHVSGPVRVERVSGDLACAHVRDVTLSEVSGDVSGKSVNGSFELDALSGDLHLRSVNGPVSVKTVHGSASLAQMQGVIELHDVGGDISLKGGLIAGNHVLVAQQDIVVRWPVGEPLNLAASAPVVTSRATMDEFGQKGDVWVGRIGDGKTNLELTAGRRIELKDYDSAEAEWEEVEGAPQDFAFPFDFAALGERISAQISEKFERAARDMEKQFGKEFGQDFGREFGEKMARKAEQAAQRAEKAAERAAQRAERATERSVRWQDSAPAPSAAPKQASAAEQLKILHMVEKGMISPDEANMLLEALES